MPQDRYQTVQEVADRLEVAEATVRQWIKAGALRAIDIGKGCRIAVTDLVRFLTARETAPALQCPRSVRASGLLIKAASSCWETKYILNAAENTAFLSGLRERSRSLASSAPA